MKKTIRNISLLLSAACIILISFSFQVQKTNVSGTWNMTVETSQGSGNPVFILKQTNDSTITGTYSGQFGEFPVTGKLKADKISISIATPELEIDYSGTVEGNTMKGKVVFGSYGDGTFTGKKKEE